MVDTTNTSNPDINVIMATGDNRGKRLIRKIRADIDKTGVAAVVAFTESGVQRIHNAIQRLSNETGQRVNVLPHSDIVKNVSVFTVLVSYETAGADGTPVDEPEDDDSLPQPSVATNLREAR